MASGETGRLAYGVSAADLDSDGADEFILSRGGSGFESWTEVFRRKGRKLQKVWSHQAVGHTLQTRTIISDIDSDGDAEIIVYPISGEIADIQVFEA